MWIFFSSGEKTLYWFKVGIFCDFRLAVLDYISFGKLGMVQCCGTLSLNLRFYGNQLFTSLVSEEKKKEKSVRIWPWPHALLRTFLALSVTGLLLCLTAPHYSRTLRHFPWEDWCSVSHWRAPLWKMLRERKAFLTFPVWLLPAGPGKENLALTRAPGCWTAVSTLCLQGSLEGQYLACVDGCVLHCTLNYSSLTFLASVTLLWGKQILGIYTSGNLMSLQILVLLLSADGNVLFW